MKEVINNKIEKILKEVTANLEKPELRTEQLTMSQNICRFFNYAKEPGLSYLIEAGTGVGKSFAYLIAILEYLNSYKTDQKQKAVIATNTISLQEQLLKKDIPIVQKHYPNIKIEKAKGRNNYICLRLLNNLHEGNLFSGSEDDEIYAKIENWLYRENGTGDRAELPIEVKNNTWNEISSSADSCHGKNCPFSNDCHYNKAMKKVEKADLIIANHAMVLTDIKAPFLPKYTHLIIDEAHNFEKNALQAFTVSVDIFRFNKLIKKLENNYCQAGLRRAEKKDAVDSWIFNIKMLAENFFNELENGRIYEKKNFENGSYLQAELRQIIPSLIKAIEKTDTAIIKVELENAINEISEIHNDLETFLLHSNENLVYWAENKKAFYAPITTYALKSFWQNKTSILTSATLSVANSFSSVIRGLNMSKEKAFTLKLDSPFDYKNNALVYLPSFSVSPKEEKYTEYIIKAIPEIVKKTNGKTFILFTSFYLMNEVYDAVNKELKDFILLKQEKGNRDIILKEFRENEKTVIFGTDTFWEGIDEDINCVIITKLPFAVPTEPIEEAQYERLKKEGKNPFMVKAVPNCALKLKQGAGRLIRHSQKKGVIAILDPRVQANWSTPIIKTLPEMQWIDDINKIDNFLNIKVVS